MKMTKRIRGFAIAASLLFAVSACTDGVSNREETCLEAGNSWQTCTGEGNSQELQLAKLERQNMMQRQNQFQYPDVEQGQDYVNHYGNEQYGSWSGGQYRFHDPQSSYAMSTNSFLLGAGIGGLAAYALLSRSNRDSWNSRNSGGWKVNSYKANRNISNKGKTLTKKQLKANKLKRKARITARKVKKNLKKGVNLTKKTVKQKTKALKKKLQKAQQQRKMAKPKNKSFKKKTRMKSKYAKKKQKQRSSTKRRKK